MRKKMTIAIFSLVLILSAVTAPPATFAAQIERKILKRIATDRFFTLQANQRCQGRHRHVVYLIDNFEQRIQLVPEVSTTYGELVKQILTSGRDDIIVRVLNTSLTRRLALVVDQLLRENCADAVISSVPGSNYTYRQASSLFPEGISIGPDNILAYHERLFKFLMRVARNGFPSSEWLQQADINASKMSDDVRKIAFAQALGHFSVPLLIPYGNEDTRHKREDRTVNLLSLAPNVMAFSGLDQLGNRITGYPYSPLSASDERAVYHIREIPDSSNPYAAHLDVNDDGFVDYTFKREGQIAFRTTDGRLTFSPPVLTDLESKQVRATLEVNHPDMVRDSLVLTAAQYRTLLEIGSDAGGWPLEKRYVRLNSPYQDTPLHFDAAPWIRGILSGTSLIPPTRSRNCSEPSSLRVRALTLS